MDVISVWHMSACWWIIGYICVGVHGSFYQRVIRYDLQNFAIYTLYHSDLHTVARILLHSSEFRWGCQQLVTFLWCGSSPHLLISVRQSWPCKLSSKIYVLVVCWFVFWLYFKGLDLRVEHTHCFSDHGCGGHYHYDVTPQEVEYLAYYTLAEKLYRIDRPVKPQWMCVCLQTGSCTVLHLMHMSSFRVGQGRIWSPSFHKMVRFCRGRDEFPQQQTVPFKTHGY